MSKKVLLVAIGLLLIVNAAGSNVFAQKTRSRNATPKPATTPATKTAATPEKAKPEPVKTGKLDFEAGLVFKNGDVKPVSRITFYLLKEDPEKIIRTEENFNLYKQDMSKLSTSNLYANEGFDKWSFYSAVLYLNEPRLAPTYVASATKALSDSQVSSTMTGFDGKGAMEDIPVGDYFMFGSYKVGRQTAMWRVPVSIKPGSNKIILDNNNMQ